MRRNDTCIPPPWLILSLCMVIGFAYADPIRPKLFTPEETTLLQRLALYWVVAALAHFAELSSHPLDTRLSLDRRLWRCLFAATIGVLLVGWARDSGSLKGVGGELGALAVAIVAIEVIIRRIRVSVEKKGGG